MDFREILSEKLPQPRPVEPARLRHDILDELNDHLVCSYHREILKGADSSVAHRRVLEQFGDPAAVACRLWLDAMRGKIMIQRVVIGASVFTAAACVALVVIFWQQTVHAQRLAALQAAVAQAREREMLDRLKEMTEAIKHPRSLDWNPVRFSLTEEAGEGSPARDVSVVVWKFGEHAAVKGNSRQSNDAGVADFGLLNPGRYNFQLSRQTGEFQLTLAGELDVQPGESLDKHIVCPKAAAQQAGVRVECNWPDDLKSQSLVVCLPLHFRYLETSPGIQWLSGFGRSVQSRTMLLGPSALVSKYERHDGGNSAGFVAHARVDSQAGQTAQVASGEYLDIADGDLERNPPGALVEFDAGTYRLIGLMVLRQLPAVEPGRQRFERLVYARNPEHWAVGSGMRAPQKSDTTGKQPRTKMTIELPLEFWRRMDSDLMVRSGQSNEWTITLPDELIQAVREALKPEKAPKDKPAAKDEATKGNG